MKSKISRALRYTIGFGCIGMLISLLVIYVESSMLATYDRNLPFISLGDNLKNRSTRAHLWFEELMAGDESINFEKEVLQSFKSCEEILLGAYNSEQTELGKFTKIDDAETYEIIKQALKESESLTRAAQERYTFKLTTASNTVLDSLGNASVATSGEEAGGALDQAFDATYEKLQLTLDLLVEHINTGVKADASFLNYLSWASVILMVLAFTVLCALIFRLQHGNDKMTAENEIKLEQETKRIENVSTFVEQIALGNYTIQVSAIDITDKLGATLVSMRDKLSKNAETDRKQNWATNGLAQIGEILRSSDSSITQLFDNIIHFVVKYTESNQGGLFIVNNESEDDQYLELLACYAYERKKFLKKRVDVGEGLVGQCFREGEKIVLLEVPKDYVSITSGLGGATPSALLLVPLAVNEKIYGVLELASFRPYEKFEINLIEKLCESIASTILSVRTNESTRMLLEKTQQQAEEMRAQEEEMRQNMEELEATQEEISRRQLDNENIIKAIDSSSVMVEFEPTGIILNANQNFINLMGYSLSEIKGQHHQLFVEPELRKSSEYINFWNDLSRGIERKGEFKRINKRGEELWINGNYTPMLDKLGQVIKIMKIAFDLTLTKQKENAYQDKIADQEYALRNQSSPSLSKEEEVRKIADQLLEGKQNLSNKKMTYSQQVDEAGSHTEGNSFKGNE